MNKLNMMGPCWHKKLIEVKGQIFQFCSIFTSCELCAPVEKLKQTWEVIKLTMPLIKQTDKSLGSNHTSAFQMQPLLHFHLTT